MMPPPTQLLVAQWVPGQSWRVEYSRLVPSPAKTPKPPPPRLLTSFWRYRVVEVDSERGLAQLLATEEGGEERTFELSFAGPLKVLVRVVMIAAHRRSDLIVHSGPDPYFGWSQSYPAIFDWPDLPQNRQAIEREFVNDEGQPIVEVLRFVPPAQFEIEMTLTREVDSGFTEVRRSTQSWAENSPWWSSAAIETIYDIDGEKSTDGNIRGRLIA
jgi:hypothetical protein